jgi:hypothetical protein
VAESDVELPHSRQIITNSNDGGETECWICVKRQANPKLGEQATFSATLSADTHSIVASFGGSNFTAGASQQVEQGVRRDMQ